jgi:hypothetical protein
VADYVQYKHCQVLDIFSSMKNIIKIKFNPMQSFFSDFKLYTQTINMNCIYGELLIHALMDINWITCANTRFFDFMPVSFDEFDREWHDINGIKLIWIELILNFYLKCSSCISTRQCRITWIVCLFRLTVYTLYSNFSIFV